jgi:hypothetical protein
MVVAFIMSSSEFKTATTRKEVWKGSSMPDSEVVAGNDLTMKFGFRQGWRWSHALSVCMTVFVPSKLVPNNLEISVGFVRRELQLYRWKEFGFGSRSVFR